MSTTTVTCITVSCDGCGQPDERDDWGTPHYPDEAEARRQLVDGYHGEPEYQWQVTDSEWLCPTCVAARVCKAAGGHDWGGWGVYGGLAFRACRRGGCQASERRPVEDTV